MIKIKKIFPLSLLLIMIVSLIGVTPITTIYAVDESDSNSVRFMVVENVDLYVDGSITPKLINLTEDFDHVMRFVWNLIWTDNDIDYDLFGTLGGPLTNGTEILYNGTEQLKPVTSIGDFGVVSYDVRIDSDDKNPHTNHLYSRLSFWKFVDQEDGIAVHIHNIQFRVNDDITAACDDFFVSVQGYKLIVPFTPPKQYPVNPFEYFNNWALWALTQPLVWLMTALSIAVIIYIFRKMI